MQRFTGQVAIVTGAASGIGRASAKRFADEGAHVLVCDINLEGATAVVDELRSSGASAFPIQVDVGVEKDVRRMIEDANSRFGRIDVLFNNAINTAAARDPSESDFFSFDPAVFESIVRVNVLGGVLACKYAIPHMIKRGGGKILFTSSTSGLAGDVGQFSYGASKAMVNWYVRTIATTFGRQGIRCNGIVPGVIRTPAFEGWVTPDMESAFLKIQTVTRLGVPEDIAALAAFLASDEAGYLNGSLYHADGGMMAPLPFVALQREFIQSEQKD